MPTFKENPSKPIACVTKITLDDVSIHEALPVCETPHVKCNEPIRTYQYWLIVNEDDSNYRYKVKHTTSRALPLHPYVA